MTFPAIQLVVDYFKAVFVQPYAYSVQADYHLIGLYRLQAYQYDMDGAPENFSGLTLQNANHQYDTELQAKAWSINTLNRLDEPKHFRHYL